MSKVSWSTRQELMGSTVVVIVITSIMAAFIQTDGAMIKNPRTIEPDAILDKALAVMEKFSITVLPVVEKDRLPVGIIHLHDILKSKLV